jgi:hypothetical protein
MDAAAQAAKGARLVRLQPGVSRGAAAASDGSGADTARGGVEGALAALAARCAALEAAGQVAGGSAAGNPGAASEQQVARLRTHLAALDAGVAEQKLKVLEVKGYVTAKSEANAKQLHNELGALSEDLSKQLEESVASAVDGASGVAAEVQAEIDAAAEAVQLSIGLKLRANEAMSETLRQDMEGGHASLQRKIDAVESALSESLSSALAKLSATQAASEEAAAQEPQQPAGGAGTQQASPGEVAGTRHPDAEEVSSIVVVAALASRAEAIEGLVAEGQAGWASLGHTVGEQATALETLEAACQDTNQWMRVHMQALKDKFQSLLVQTTKGVVKAKKEM